MIISEVKLAWWPEQGVPSLQYITFPDIKLYLQNYNTENSLLG